MPVDTSVFLLLWDFKVAAVFNKFSGKGLTYSEKYKAIPVMLSWSNHSGLEVSLQDEPYVRAVWVY